MIHAVSCLYNSFYHLFIILILYAAIFSHICMYKIIIRFIVMRDNGWKYVTVYYIIRVSSD